MRHLTLLLALAACGDPEASSVQPPREPLPEEPTATPSPPRLRRLTEQQYLASVASLLGPDVVLTLPLEPDAPVNGLDSVGAATLVLSPLGVERYEAAAYSLADQRVALGLDGWLPCDTTDAACVDEQIGALGRLAYRRALTPDEHGALVALYADVAAVDGSDQGWRDVLAALLQSPWFLYRVEVGDGGQLTDSEWAVRASFVLWGQPPDDALLDAVEAGRAAPSVRAALVDDMLADPRLAQGVRAWVTEWWHLSALDSVDKDPLVFPSAHPDLWPAAKEETLWLVATLALEDADWRDMLTTRRTAIDPRLAALYGVPAPSLAGLAETTLPADSPRVGVLGHASFLASHAHATRTSATGRGLFVRSAMLCQSVPEPPADVDTSIPEPDSTSPTLRDRLQVHLEDPACSTCHLLTDPIGLAFETFDGVGAYRTTERGAMIDPSGELSDVAFDDARGLAAALRDEPGLLPCWSDTWAVYAMGGSLRSTATREWLADRWLAQGVRVRPFLRDLVLSDAFSSVEVNP